MVGINNIKPFFGLTTKPFIMKKNLTLFLGCILTCSVFCQNQNISNGLAFDGEPYMVIDPVNSNHIVVAWIGFTFGNPVGIKTKVSTNGGTSWSTENFLPHFSPNFHSADPSMDYDNAGNLWACYIDYRQSPDSGAVYVVKSTDGGFNWGSASAAIDAFDDGTKKPIDRPWLAINPTNNHFYITSKPPPWVLPPNRPYFSHSLDGGSTWESWRYVDSTNYLVGPAIAQPMTALDVGNDGKVHVMYPSYVSAQNLLPGFIHASSVNDGNSFSYHPGVYAIPGTPDTLVKGGYNLKVDPSDVNHLAFAFCFRPNGGDFDVHVTESTNGGINWSTPVRVNNDVLGNGKIQDLVWCDFDTDGDLIVGWRDRRNSSGTGYATESDIWGAIKWKDSTNFSTNFRIADSLANYNAVLAQNGNDFMNIAMRNDTMYAVWGDVRTGILNIWFAKKSLLTGSTIIENISNEAIPSITIFPVPATENIQMKGDEVLHYKIIDINGKILIDKINTENSSLIDISTLPVGTYLIEMQTLKGNLSSKFIKQ